jgi:hypothetical protein
MRIEQIIIIALLLIQLMLTIYCANYRGESYAAIPAGWGGKNFGNVTPKPKK